MFARFDYIVIGGGTSGCALAATLSQSATVLVLERGGSPYDNPTATDIGNFATTFSNTSPKSWSQLFVSEDGVYNTRARVLGGGSVLNAGFYTRAGDDYVKEAEWMSDETALKDGLLEAGEFPYNGFTYDHINGTKIGGTIFDDAGQRHTAANLLEYSNPDTVAVYLHATVHKILFTTKGRPRPKAYGVIFQDANGVLHKAELAKNAMNEVILAAGAIGSPQLLLLSGVGPMAHLAAHGIKPVVLDHPMVGQGMGDNPMNAIFIPSPTPVEVSLIQVVGITRFDSYIEGASGKVAGPVSRGHLELRNINPNDNPSVRFNYYQEPEDLEKCVEGIATIIKVINSKAFSKFKYPEATIHGLLDLILSVPTNLRPRHVTSVLNLKQFCIDTVMTIWHYHGGCQVGRVVDKNYKVLGIDGLRVIDGSTFLKSPGTNPQATVMMLGRYMGFNSPSWRVGRALTREGGELEELPLAKVASWKSSNSPRWRVGLIYGSNSPSWRVGRAHGSDSPSWRVGRAPTHQGGELVSFSGPTRHLGELVALLGLIRLFIEFVCMFR
ncbi:hypothetical protein Bca4012_010635 [Brassica carinata]